MKSNYFYYNNGDLFCEDFPLRRIAEDIGTPAYVYSKRFFKDRIDEFSNAFKDISHRVYYATKANYNLNVMKIFMDSGAGLDVNSAGELYRALKIGAQPEDLILTGVGKTAEEISLGLDHNVKMIKAESFEEILLINQIAKEKNKTAPLAIRINPDVDPKTHPYISTGLAENKFGIDSKVAIELCLKASRLSNIKVTGLDMHIGSQIKDVSPYIESVKIITELFFELKNFGLPIQHIDIGGGMGIKYLDEVVFSPKELADSIIPVLKKTDCEIFFEPGRSLTANGGVILTKILYCKENRGKNFIITDASMTDLLRPSIYSAYHHIQPLTNRNDCDITADIVGPVCESGDFLGKNRNITECKAGDYLAIMSSGAYAMVMASNYNARRKAPEIIVDSDKYYVTRSRETYDHLLHDEKIIPGIHD